MCASSGDATDKKRKKGQGGKGPEGAEEGEIACLSQQPPTKEARMTRAEQKKSVPFWTSKGSKGEQRLKALAWRPSFMVSSRSPVMDDANLRDPQKGKSGILAKCLEKILLLPEDMQELRSFRKREVFLSLRRYLVKVCNHLLLFIN